MISLPRCTRGQVEGCIRKRERGANKVMRNPPDAKLMLERCSTNNVLMCKSSSEGMQEPSTDGSIASSTPTACDSEPLQKVLGDVHQAGAYQTAKKAKKKQCHRNFPPARRLLASSRQTIVRPGKGACQACRRFCSLQSHFSRNLIANRKSRAKGRISADDRGVFLAESEKCCMCDHVRVKSINSSFCAPTDWRTDSNGANLRITTSFRGHNTKNCIMSPLKRQWKSGT